MSKVHDLRKSVHLKPKLIEAREVAKSNTNRAEGLQKDFQTLQERSDAIDRNFQNRLEIAFNAALVPFAEAFAGLKNVDLESPELMDRVPTVASASPEMTKVSVGAVQGLVALSGGAALGAGTGAVTFASVAAFATASTGTAIGTLSGAAATSATLAWLGGGSLAAGGMGMAGGMAVLAGLVAVPAVLALGGFVSFRGRKELAKQQMVTAELDAAQQQYRLAQRTVDAVAKRVADAEQTLNALTKVMTPENGWLANLVTVKDNYRDFTAEEKNRLAVLVGLATAMATVMQAPLSSANGVVNPEHARLMADAKELARNRTTARTGTQ